MWLTRKPLRSNKWAYALSLAENKIVCKTYPATSSNHYFYAMVLDGFNYINRSDRVLFSTIFEDKQGMYYYFTF